MEVDNPLLDRGLVWQLPQPVLLSLVDRLLGGAVVAAEHQIEPDEFLKLLS
jgi:hypothetical protein